MLNETTKSEVNSNTLNILEDGFQGFSITDPERMPIDIPVDSLDDAKTDSVEKGNLKGVVDSNVQSSILYNMDEFKSSVVISHFQTETVSDFVGVLISGLRLKLLNANGDVKMVDFFLIQVTSGCKVWRTCIFNSNSAWIVIAGLPQNFRLYISMARCCLWGTIT
jgi:hypothetical protein